MVLGVVVKVRKGKELMLMVNDRRGVMGLITEFRALGVMRRQGDSM